MLSLYYKRHSDESNTSPKGSHTSGVTLKQNMSQIVCPLHFKLPWGTDW